jgi:hypothetical protein
VLLSATVVLALVLSPYFVSVTTKLVCVTLTLWSFFLFPQKQ